MIHVSKCDNVLVLGQDFRPKYCYWNDECCSPSKPEIKTGNRATSSQSRANYSLDKHSNTAVSCQLLKTFHLLNNMQRPPRRFSKWTLCRCSSTRLKPSRCVVSLWMVDISDLNVHASQINN